MFVELSVLFFFRMSEIFDVFTFTFLFFFKMSLLVQVRNMVVCCVGFRRASERTNEGTNRQ